MAQLNAVGIVVSDMARSIAFYRLLGLDVPETPDEGHVETFLASGVRLMLDSEETVRSFRPDWTRQAGNQLALALECASPAEVDETVRAGNRGRLPGREGAVGRVLGAAVRAARGPGRRAGGSLRRALNPESPSCFV